MRKGNEQQREMRVESKVRRTFGNDALLVAEAVHVKRKGTSINHKLQE